MLRTLGQAARHPRRHLRRGAVPVQQAGQPQAAHQPHRRDRMDRARQGRQGRGLRGAAGKGRQRREEGGRAILHAARAHPVDRPLHEARPASAQPTSPSAIRRAAPAASSSRPTNGSIALDEGCARPRPSPSGCKSKTYFGQELVARPRRLALMNLYLHGIEPTSRSATRSTNRRRRRAST